MKLALIIPAFNEAASIEAVVLALNCYGTPVVIDDGSTDQTGELACNAGAEVVVHVENCGYDSALSSGLMWALAHGFDFAITIDGDGQHDVAHVEDIATEFHNGADVVIGVRDSFQRVSERIFSFAAKRLWGICDPLCGMKGYRLSRFVEKGCHSSYRSIGTELAIRAVRSGWRIAQVPMATKLRQGKSRFGSGVRANWLILRSMLIGIFFK